MHHRAKTKVTHFPPREPPHARLTDLQVSQALGRVNRKSSAFAADYLALDRLSRLMYSIATSKGFHRGDPRRRKDGSVVLPPKFGDWCMNLVAEIAELWEAYRKGMLTKQCDKPIVLTCAEEELADVVIRAMDTATMLGISLGRAIAVKTAYNKTRSYRHGNKKA